MSVRVLVAAVFGLVAAASSAAADVAHLRLDFGPPGPSINYRNDRSCALESMSWIDEAGRVVWTRPAPARLRGKAAICECGAEDPRNRMWSAWRPCERSVEGAHVHSPEWLDFLIGVERRDGVVAIADWDGVVTIAEEDGRTIGDWTRPKTHGADVPVDHASYRLEGVRRCRGRTRGATIVAWCGDRLLYFDNVFAAVLGGPSLRVIASAFAKPRDVVRWTKGYLNRARARIRLGRYRLVVDGTYDDHP